MKSTFFNQKEIDAIINFILIPLHKRKKVGRKDIAIITPYESQRKTIFSYFQGRKKDDFQKFLMGIQVAKINPFQGEEKEVVKISIV